MKKKKEITWSEHHEKKEVTWSDVDSTMNQEEEGMGRCK